MPQSRRWTLNGDFLGLEPNGVSRYGRETTLALDALVKQQHPLTVGLQLDLVAATMPHDFNLDRIAIRIVPEWRQLRLPQVWCQWQLPRQVPGGLVSFCNLAPVAVKRHIVCIHDLHTRVLPESYGRGFRLAHRVILPLLGRRARALTTVSELSRAQLDAHGVAPAHKVSVTYNGADHARNWAPSRARLKLERTRPFVLGIGRAQPYKNTQLFWLIAPELERLGIDVVLAGDLPPSIAASYGPQPPNIHLLGRISDDDLALAMDRALCLLFPSRSEGFGLPAAEAMVRGCPIVASTAPCLPEICADAAMYADPDAPEQWTDAIKRLHASAAARTQLILRGRQRAEAFSWRRIAEIYLGLMAEIDGAHSGTIRMPTTDAVTP